MACRELDAVHFVTNQMSVEETERFLDHVEKCQKCAEFLDMVVRLRANREFISEQLTVRPTGKRSVSLIETIRYSLSEHWKAYGLIAVAILLVLASFFYARRSAATKGYASLATTEAYPFVPAKLMGKQTDVLQRALLSEGIDLYNGGDYKGAEGKLLSYLESNKSDPEAHFLLALCYYFQDKVDEAIGHLNLALDLSKDLSGESGRGKIREKYYWFLAHCFLKKQDKIGALKALQNVAGFHGDYLSDAKDLIGKIQRIDSRK